MSSRYFKKAVHRNRIKRLLRESVRLQKHALLQQLEKNNKGLEIFLIYQSNELPLYADIFAKTGKVFQRLEKMINENPQ